MVEMHSEEVIGSLCSHTPRVTILGMTILFGKSRFPRTNVRFRLFGRVCDDTGGTMHSSQSNRISLVSM